MSFSLTDEKILKEVWKLYRSGKRRGEIAKAMGCTYPEEVQMLDAAEKIWGRGPKKTDEADKPKFRKGVKGIDKIQGVLPDPPREELVRAKGQYSNPQWHEIYQFQTTTE